MDAKKALHKIILNNSFSDAFEVRFWDGEIISYGEEKPKFRIVFNTPILSKDLIKDPFLALGEGYMTKKIDIEGSLQQTLESLYNNNASFLNSSNRYLKLRKTLANTIKSSKNNVCHHYDVGNDFYQLWLDETMTYSCGYFKSPADSLAQAQKNKVEHILKKLCIKEGQTLLDIGCGWGDLVITAAKEYKVKALGITLSSEQLAKVKERIETQNLNDLVDVQLADYRELKSMKFDRIVSVGMLEHVGKECLSDYFNAVNRLLKSGGVSILHCITRLQEKEMNTWLNKYIFPGGYIPTVQELLLHLSDIGFYLIDAESLRRHYAKTVEHWSSNFEDVLSEISKIKDETFIRMWRLYLNASAASFNCGKIDIYQFLFTKGLTNELPWTREYMYRE
ncbi:MAG: SAM-dependent methyltransferase [Gracilibacter sp. BRH_c7a]|nr:MAG: SAM-dependent methyltransferase [Gracilibacter sp. BRH_c7a]